MTLYASRIAALGTENAFRVGDDIARVTPQLAARGIDVIRLNIGEPDFDSAPHINDAGCAAIHAGKTHYTDPQGILPLRAAIAAHVKRTRGIPVDPAQVIVTTGGKPSIGFTMQAYVNPGDEVIYPSPGFPIYESWVTYVGAKAVPLPLREDRNFIFTADDLAERITKKTKVIILCSPSNPTGGVFDKSDLEQLAKLIRRTCGPEVRVYSDEIYEDIIFDGHTHHSIASEPGMAERTIIASGHSKGFAMTGWRLGWAVLPTVDEAQVFKQLTINTVSCVPPFIQEAGRAALESPLSPPVVARMVAAFQDRRDKVVAAFNRIPGVTCQTPKGAFYLFPNVGGMCRRFGLINDEGHPTPIAEQFGTPARALQAFLLERFGVATMDRHSFGRIGADGQHFLRVSIAAGLERLLEATERIARAANDQDAFTEFASAHAASAASMR
ncbi:MAG TPA: pyridoxal phosphate-dependent aminotransferase [Gemmatimonadaceae bacterium]|nr:pyridoxal phosphate-dependent aminotransferase [Gemmatimonadaceae bacterium]